MASSIPPHSLRIAVDRGGTFTDIWANFPDPDSSKIEQDSGKSRPRKEIILKLLSHDPGNYKDAPREGVRRVMELVSGKKIGREEKLGWEAIDFIRLSTTVGTNALLERKGAKHALMITKGFKDLLEIGNQSRPRIFDLAIRKPDVLYSKVVEIDERVTLLGYTSDPNRASRALLFSEGQKVDDGSEAKKSTNPGIERGYDGLGVEDMEKEYGKGKVVKGLSGEAVWILKDLDVEKSRRDLQALYDDGYRVLAIVLLHSYTFPDHELLLSSLAREIGFTHLSVSSQSTPGMIKTVSRGTSSTADAYLTPILREYVDGFFEGFEESEEGRGRVEFMMSDGGLTDAARFSGLKSILSGPAGGVVGFALTSYDHKTKTPVIGLDMGGTSTDVSRYDGRYEIVFETTTAGVTVQSPQLDINTVAAGGGSRLFFRNGLFTTGPESAGSHPGPACYRKGGPLAVTDANLILGRLVPDFFPKIFGPNENESIDIEASRVAFEELVNDINIQTGKDMSLDEVAWGFLKVANETMCRPIRTLTEARGFSASKHVLACFGGAGGQHACSLADTLGIKTILVHKYSSVLSAYGMALADRVFEKQEPSSDAYSEQTKANFQERIDSLVKDVRAELAKQGFPDERIHTEPFLNMRYEGTDTALMTSAPDGKFLDAFPKAYKQEFGFLLEGKPVVVDDVRVRGVGKSFDTLPSPLLEAARELQFTALTDEERRTKSDRHVSVYFSTCGRVDTPVFLLEKLDQGKSIQGPAVVIDETQTVIVEEHWEAKILERGVVIEARA